MAHSVKRLTLDFGSGHDLTVHEPSAQNLLGIFFLSLSKYIHTYIHVEDSILGALCPHMSGT